jgi:hypothetical protein
MAVDPLETLVAAYFDHEDIDPMMRFQDGRSKVQFVMDPNDPSRLAFLGIWATEMDVFWFQGRPIQEGIGADGSTLDLLLTFLVNHAKEDAPRVHGTRARIQAAAALGLPLVPRDYSPEAR